MTTSEAHVCEEWMMSGVEARRFCRACGKYESERPFPIRLSVRVRHYRDSPWREYVLVGTPDGRWSGAGEGDYYVDPTDWADIVSWLVDMHEYEALTLLEPGALHTIDSLTRIVRDR